jgi:hypothetical protein
MLNGLLVIGSNSASGSQAEINFVRDYGVARMGSTIGYNGVTIANRNAAATGDRATDVLAALVSQNINDVAMTVLPNAPVDVATGLPVPTIAVATDGGVSVIMNDGNVWDVTVAGLAAKSVKFDSNNRIIHTLTAYGNVYTYAIPSADNTASPPTGANSYSYAVTIPAYPFVQTGNLVAPLDNGFALASGSGSTFGLVLLNENVGTQAASMLTAIDKTFCSGWMPGDIRLAALSDTTAETLTASGELVTNGDFPTDTTGWTAVGSTLSVVSAALRITSDAGGYGQARQTLTTVAGKTYTLTLDSVAASGWAVYVEVGSTYGGSQLLAASWITTGSKSFMFTAASATSYLKLQSSGSAGSTADFDNVSVKCADADRCIKGNSLTVNGSITKAAVATGANLVGYSGWSAANYLARAYDADFDFGTGTFWVGGWLKMAANSAIETLLERDSASTAQRFTVSVTAAGYLEFTCDDNTTTRTATGTVAVDDGVLRFVSFSYSAGTLTIKINGTSYASATGAALLTLNNASAVLDIGKDVAGSYPATNATMALWRISATIPSTEQELHIYETEKALFQANTQCTLAGTSNSIIALGYDEDSDLLHAMTSYGRSTFKGLVRVASEATGVGTPKAVAASGGAILQLGSTSSDIYIPAYSLREEMTRLDEQTAAFGAPTQFFDFDATASQTTFTLGVGWEIVAVYAASGAGSATLQREGSGKQWTRSFDGFKWSAVFASGRSASDWVSIEARRIVK